MLSRRDWRTNTRRHRLPAVLSLRQRRRVAVVAVVCVARADSSFSMQVMTRMLAQCCCSPTRALSPCLCCACAVLSRRDWRTNTRRHRLPAVLSLRQRRRVAVVAVVCVARADSSFSLQVMTRMLAQCCCNPTRALSLPLLCLRGSLSSRLAD